MPEKQQYFDGKKFTRDESTGYYLCSTQSQNGQRKRMHVYVWEYYNGAVPEGYHIHHKDGDRSNNEISNLELLPQYEHLSFHGKESAEKNHEKMIKNLTENALPRASEWHKKQEGRDWHKRHYENMKDRLYVARKFTCKHCEKQFTSKKSDSKFCSNNCKAAYRRLSGIDNVLKNCQDCGGEYVANKYSKTKYCPICKNKKHSRNRKSRCL